MRILFWLSYASIWLAAIAQDPFLVAGAALGFSLITLRIACP